MGFTLPFKRWMVGSLGKEIERKLAYGEEGVSAIGLNSSGVLRVWRRFQKDPEAVGWSRPWALYVLQKWCELNEVKI